MKVLHQGGCLWRGGEVDGHGDTNLHGHGYRHRNGHPNLHWDLHRDLEDALDDPVHKDGLPDGDGNLPLDDDRLVDEDDPFLIDLPDGWGEARGRVVESGSEGRKPWVGILVAAEGSGALGGWGAVLGDAPATTKLSVSVSMAVGWRLPSPLGFPGEGSLVASPPVHCPSPLCGPACRSGASPFGSEAETGSMITDPPRLPGGGNLGGITPRSLSVNPTTVWAGLWLRASPSLFSGPPGFPGGGGTLATSPPVHYPA